MPKAAMKKRKTSRKRVSKTAVTKNQLGRLVRSYVTNIEEKKYANFTATTSTTWNAGYSVAATWNFFSVLAKCFDATLASQVGIIQGTDRNQRVGNKIRLHRIDFNVLIVPVVSATMQDGSICRVVVYHNKDPQGTTPTAAQAWTTDVFNAQRYEQYRNRISLLKDFTHTMVATSTNAGAVASAGPQFLGKFSIYPKQVVEYNASSGGIGSIMKHDYGVALCADTVTCCTATVTGTVVYTDV